MRFAATLLIISMALILPMFSYAQDEAEIEETEEWGNVTFDLDNLDGDDMTEEEVFTDGTIYLVDFWASWCRPCNQYLPHLEDIVNDYSEYGLKVVIFCIDEAGSISEARTTLNSADYPFTILFDTEQEVKDELGVQRIPTTLIFNSAGDELWRHIGYASGDEEEVRETVEGLLPGFETEDCDSEE